MKNILKGLFGALNGRKMALGIALIVIGGYTGTIIDIATGDIISDIGWTVSGLGALHKLWKGT
jgi:hypothetical protein